MYHGIYSPRLICHALSVGGVALLCLLPADSVVAEQVDRLAPYLRQYASPADRSIRQVPVMATEPMHRNEMDDRTVRRWSPEERRQLRRDVHEAGRDVYGSPPRRPD